jgi:hypothetical protein
MRDSNPMLQVDDRSNSNDMNDCEEENLSNDDDSSETTKNVSTRINSNSS